MLLQVHDALLHAMSGTELSRVRTELRLLPPEPIKQSLLASRGASIVMQSGWLWSSDRFCNYFEQLSEVYRLV
jgi:hypothetical protein